MHYFDLVIVMLVTRTTFLLSVYYAFQFSTNVSAQQWAYII